MKENLFLLKDYVCIDELDDIVNKYNNTIHRTIKMKPIDVTGDSYVEYNDDFNKKVLNLKLVIMLEFLSTKVFLLKDMFQIGEVFIVNEIKNTVPCTYTSNDLNGENVIGTFYEKEFQKTNQKEFRIEKILTRAGDKSYVKWKVYDNSFNSWIIKKDIV